MLYKEYGSSSILDSLMHYSYVCSFFWKLLVVLVQVNLCELYCLLLDVLLPPYYTHALFPVYYVFLIFVIKIVEIQGFVSFTVTLELSGACIPLQVAATIVACMALVVGE